MQIKTKITTIIVLVFIVFKFCIVQAQNNQTNLDKYWHYRYRLVNYFMVVGDGPGESLPAAIRNHYDGTNTLSWGETPRPLGWYIGVLVTEYRLLANNGQWDALNRTKMELWYALKAIERLDQKAEDQWHQNTGEINGFILRDDVPLNFVKNHSYDGTAAHSVLNKGLVQNVWPQPAFTQNSGEPGFVGRDDPDPNKRDPGVSSAFSSGDTKSTASQDMIEELLLEFQNKKEPQRIEVLKVGKNIKLKLKKNGNVYFYKGKLTSITDTSLVLNNTNPIMLKFDTILDYRFSNHPFGRILLGAAGVGVFLGGVLATIGAVAVATDVPSLIIFNGSIAIVGVGMFEMAVAKKRHSIDKWNISVKKYKK